MNPPSVYNKVASQSQDYYGGKNHTGESGQDHLMGMQDGKKYVMAGQMRAKRTDKQPKL